MENKKRKNEIVKQEESANTPQTMINLAINKGADLDKLEKLLTLQERWEKNEDSQSV